MFNSNEINNLIGTPELLELARSYE